MAILSTTPMNLTSLTATTHRHRHHFLPTTTPKPPNHRRPISALHLPSSSPTPPPGNLYQPFRPPPSPLPKQYRSLSAVDRLDILRNRLGLWYEYAPLIPSLSQEGFTPPSIEEVTGITGVEQNHLVVAAQVRDSLVSSAVDPETLSYFDLGGAELLYEIRLLSAILRAASARRIVERRLDAKATQQLARAVKDFPRRQGDVGWESFSAASPGDCLAYSYFRLSREAMSPEEKRAALDRAMDEAETEAARERILKELVEKSTDEEEENGVATKIGIPVVRLRYGEVAESTSVAVLPVYDARNGETGLAEAPRCRVEGEFGILAANSGWRKWVVLPGWEPVMTIGDGGGVVVAFGDARMLPWKTYRWEKEEAVLVVTDRGRTAVTEDTGFYLIGKAGGELAVERGRRLRELGMEAALGTVVLVVRPPRDEVDYQISDEDWD